mmetsp:Transcript_30857/g.35629  ORF Transcript_30857/g.35629 Transcript_30857/m.35629 type:complete len:201 (-) Transcript_30857:31-633(-)
MDPASTSTVSTLASIAAFSAAIRVSSSALASAAAFSPAIRDSSSAFALAAAFSAAIRASSSALASAAAFSPAIRDSSSAFALAAAFSAAIRASSSALALALAAAFSAKNSFFHKISPHSVSELRGISTWGSMLTASSDRCRIMRSCARRSFSSARLLRRSVCCSLRAACFSRRSSRLASSFCHVTLDSLRTVFCSSNFLF